MGEYEGFRFGVRTVVCQATASLSEVVAAQLAQEAEPTPLTSLELIELGAVYVNDSRSLDPSWPTRSGDVVRIHTRPRRFREPSDLAACIVTETEDSLLVEKPAGLPSEPVVDNCTENLLSFLEHLRGQSLFLTHRLSVDSEGLCLIAKDRKAQERITRAFADGRIKRSYVAYVQAPVPVGVLGASREPRPNSIASHAQVDGDLRILSCEEQRAVTNLITHDRKTWRVVGEPLQVFYRIELEFTRVRPKEVRSQLALSGAPVLGDQVSGSRVQLVDSETQKSAMAFRATSLTVLDDRFV